MNMKLHLVVPRVPLQGIVLQDLLFHQESLSRGSDLKVVVVLIQLLWSLDLVLQQQALMVIEQCQNMVQEVSAVIAVTNSEVAAILRRKKAAMSMMFVIHYNYCC